MSDNAENPSNSSDANVPDADSLADAPTESLSERSLNDEAADAPEVGETLFEIGAETIFNVPAGDGDSETQALTRRVEGPAKGPGGLRYDVRSELGRGGMGVVYEAYDRDLMRTVALKIARDASGGSTRSLRFVEEAQITGQLSHPNIVPVHDVGRDADDSIWFTMKRVDGRSLKQVIRDARNGETFTLARKLYIFRQLLNGLAFAHDREVLHRDLKPDNIMIGEYGEVLIMDWGLAKLRGRPDGLASKITTSRLQTPGSNTLDGEVIGTPAYMSPEQARGENESIDQRSDIYSLGAVLYEMLALRPAFEARDVRELLEKVANETADPPSKRNPDALVPHGVENVCMRCLAADPNERFANVGEIQAALEDALNRTAEAEQDSAVFALLGKVLVLSVALSSFLFTAMFIMGPENLDFGSHLGLGIPSGLAVLGIGTLLAWIRPGLRKCQDATQALLLWDRAGVGAGSSRGYFAAEIARRAKFRYFVPALLILPVGFFGHTVLVVQWLAAGLTCALAISLVEHSAYRKLDRPDLLYAQVKRHTFGRFALVGFIVLTGVAFMVRAGWDGTTESAEEGFKRGTAVVNGLAILGGVWALAHFSHPSRLVNQTMRELLVFWRRPRRSTELAAMGTTYASMSLNVGALGTLTWLGLIGSNAGGVPVSFFVMALTPLWAGILWMVWFRWRAGRLEMPHDEMSRRVDEYLKSPVERKGTLGYLALWAPFVVLGLLSFLGFVGYLIASFVE